MSKIWIYVLDFMVGLVIGFTVGIIAYFSSTLIDNVTMKYVLYFLIEMVGNAAGLFGIYKLTLWLVY